MCPFPGKVFYISPAVVLVASTGFRKPEYTDIGKGRYLRQLSRNLAAEVFVLPKSVDANGLDGRMSGKEGWYIVGMTVPDVLVIAAIWPDSGFVVVPEDDVILRKQGLFLVIVYRHRLSREIA